MVEDEDYPRELFLFYIEDGLDERSSVAMLRSIGDLAKTKTWTIAPPRFFDEVEEPERPEIDEPVRTVGGVLEIFSAKSETQPLPMSIDRKHYEEITYIVESMANLARTTGVSLAFELGGVQVGWIENGEADELLQHGLLAPWREAVGA